MAFDGIVTAAAAKELNDTLAMGKIEKVYQPETDELVFHVHTHSGNFKLYATCNSNHAGVYLIDKSPQNPPSPLGFCMLLRKHLQGSRIVDISQVVSERIIEINLETMDELGFSVNKKLVIEIMGKHSNIILVDTGANKIMDSIKRISIDVNRARQILPGKLYEYPPAQDKIPFRTVTEAQIEAICGTDDYDLGAEGAETLAQKLLSGIQGISPVIARQLAQTPKAGTSSTSNIYRTLDSYRRMIDEGTYTAAVYEKAPKTPADFHVIPLEIYNSIYDRIGFDTVSKAVDYYFTNKDSSNRTKQKSNDLKRSVKTHLSKLYLKKKRLGEDLIKAEKANIYRLYGELITANLHSIKTGDKEAVLTNYYDNEPITIPLDIRYAPARNAQIYFKKYSKSKTALKEKKVQLAENDREIAYLESVSAFIENAATVEEVDALRTELIESGILRKKKTRGPAKKEKLKPMEFFTSEGFRILVGRNNKENDQLTLKTASSKDIWFHTKDIPGSHVILFTEGKTPSEKSIFEAAGIAAYHSKGRSSENVPVDYTLVKHVKKPSGAKPGMVIFTDNKTVYVTPKER